MNRILLCLLFICIVSINVYGQKWNDEIICSSDTIAVTNHYSMKYRQKKSDTLNFQPYKFVKCESQSNIGVRFELGISSHHYSEKTRNWIGNYAGPDFNFILVIKKLNVGFRFKPWTVNPKTELSFRDELLPKNAKLNPIKLEYYGGYSIDFDKLISIEPYIGYNRSLFFVINEDELHQKYSFKNANGLITGVSLNKYIDIKNYRYMSLFGTAGYGFVNYKKVQQELDNGYFEWGFGIAYKSFFTKRSTKKVN